LRIAELRDRDLVRLYWPVELRAAFDALFAIDDVMAEVVASSTQPALGAIRLAWWREALERLDHDASPPEPRLQAAAAELLPRGVTGKDLAALEEGYAALLDEVRDEDRVGAGGAALFAIGATLLGAGDDRLGAAGRLHAFARAARRGQAAFPDEAGSLVPVNYRFPRPLRPLTAFARLAARDLKRAPVLEAEATPARAAALLAHRLFGTID
jgi:phytoene synthase